jgi:hypothetical protein
VRATGGSDAVGQTPGLPSNVVDDYRDDGPSEFLNARESLLVAEHLGLTHVPIDAVVLCGHPLVGPRKVNTPQLSVPAVDLVVQLRPRQTKVDHDQARFAFHPRLGAAVCVLDELSHLNDPAAALLLAHRTFEFGACASQRMQRWVQRGKSSRSAQLSRYLHSGPRGRRRQSARNPLQRSTRTLMDHQTDGAPILTPGSST